MPVHAAASASVLADHDVAPFVETNAEVDDGWMAIVVPAQLAIHFMLVSGNTLKLEVHTAPSGEVRDEEVPATPMKVECAESQISCDGFVPIG